MTLKITQKIVNAVLAHGRRAEPNEACGYLASKDGVIERIFELTNIDEAPDHYSMDPEEQFATIRKIREEGLRLEAAYHTHPETPARPSVEDIRLAYDPNIVYLIGSLMAGVEPVLAYKINKGVVTGIPLTIVAN